MSYWGTEKLRAQGHLLVAPFDAAQVKNCAFELRLGREAYVTGGEVGRKVSLSAKGDQVIIPPGQFALLLTEERVMMPSEALGFISVKYSFKATGLVNVSGFHVDPGFSGQLVFSVYNAGGSEIVISRGESLFLLWFASLEQPTADLYDGSRANQDSIRNEDIMRIGHEHYSPARVNDRLTAVEVRSESVLNIARALLVGVVLAIVVPLAFQTCDSKSVAPDQSRPSSQVTTLPRTPAPPTPSP